MQTAISEVAEQRVLLKRVSWETSNQLLIELGEDRAMRLFYHEGLVEIMTPLGPHESSNRFIDDLIRVIADELNLNLKKFGSLTLKRDTTQTGAELDSCYYIQNEPLVRGKQEIDLKIDPPPDLVLEIDITSGSLDKRPIYAALGVPKLWRYDGQKLEAFVLQESSLAYNPVQQSPTFPSSPLDSVPPLIRQSLVDGETATLRAFRAWVREHNR